MATLTPPDDGDALRKERERRLREDPVRRYQPIPSFQEIVACTAQDQSLECANQMGKSSLLQWTCAALARGLHPTRPWYGPMRIAVVVPMRTHAVEWTNRLLVACQYQGALRDLANAPLIPAWELDGEPTYAHGSSAGKYAAVIRLKNGSQIFVFLSDDPKSWKKMEGWTFDAVIRDEYSGSESMGATVSRGLLAARTAAKNGDKPLAGLYFWATTSTDPNEEWEAFKEQCKGSPNARYFSARPEEANDYVSMEVREEWGKTLSEEMREVRVYGRASAASQITIYAQYLKEVGDALYEEYDPTPRDNVGLLYDPGWKDPCGIVRFWIPEHRPHDLIIDRFASYKGGTRMQHVQTMLELLEGRTASWIICDPNIQKTESNGISYFVQFVQDLVDARLKYHALPMKGRNRNEDGIPLVIDYLTGKTPGQRLTFDRRHPSVEVAVSQLMGYRWKQDSQGNLLKTPYSSRRQRDESCDLVKYLCSCYPYWIDYGADSGILHDPEEAEPIDPLVLKEQEQMALSQRLMDEWFDEQRSGF